MVQSKFFHFFPVPSFLQMPAAGISIADDAIRVIRFSSANNALKLEAYGTAELPPNAITNGMISNSDAVVEVLSELRKKYGLKLVRATIPDEKLYIFKVEIPELSPGEIRSALEFKIEENAPVSVEDAVFDYVVEREEGEEGLKVVVAAAHKKAVTAYTDVLARAGLQPLSLEIESQAIANAVIPYDEKSTILLINFEAIKTGLYLAKSGVVQFSLTIPNEPSAESGEDIKASLTAEKSAGAYDKLYSPKYKKLPLLREEAERILNYWQSREGKGEEGYKLILSGADAADKDFVDHFSKLLNREVSVGSVWANAFSVKDHLPDLPEAESYGYAAAIGAALSEFRKRPE